MGKAKRAVPFILPLVVYAYPSVFMYARNVKEVSFTHMLIALGIMVAFGYMVFALSALVFRRVWPAALMTAGAGLFLLNYGFVAKLAYRFTVHLRIWHIIPIAIACLVLCVYFVWHKLPSLAEGLTLLASLCFAALLIINLATALPVEITKQRPAKLSNEFASLEIEAKADRPNIYYILLDEYASFTQCEQDFAYINTPLETFFRDNNFNNSLNSLNNSVYTDIVMTNIMALDYVVDISSPEKTNNALRLASPMRSILKQAGYDTQGVGVTDWLGFANINSGDGVDLSNSSAKDFLYLTLKNTAFYCRFMNVKQFGSRLDQIESSMNTFDTFEIEPDSSMFTFYYLCSPHSPFYFAEDGSYNSEEEQFDDDNLHNERYIGQLKYITQRTIPAVQRIIEQDPNSIIIFSSDHGYRHAFNAAAPTPIEDKLRILNALYYAGKPLEEFKNKSGVNTMRMVFNELLGLNLEYVEAPAYVAEG